MIKEESLEILTEYQMTFNTPIRVYRMNDGTEIAECRDMTGEPVTFNLSLDVK